MIVDLPLPVPPITAVVSPLQQVNDRCDSVSSSASAKRKETFSKDTMSVRSTVRTDSAPSVISGFRFSTSDTRRMQVKALGNIRIVICAIMT